MLRWTYRRWGKFFYPRLNRYAVGFGEEDMEVRAPWLSERIFKALDVVRIFLSPQVGGHECYKDGFRAVLGW